MIFKLLPGNSVCFEMDVFFESRNNGLRVVEVQPNDEIVIGNFEAKGICAFERKMLKNML